MPETLAVYLGRDEPRSLEAPASFETSGSFEVKLANHGQATHVHLRLEGDLAAAGRIEGDNPYVPGGETERVHVLIEPTEETIRGALVVATGYGAEEARVSVELSGPVTNTVEVDESLAEPPPREEPSLLARFWLPLLFVAVAVIAGLAVVAFLLSDDPSIAAGVAVGLTIVFAIGAALLS